ncbi:MAG: TetR/AcrR family transcriptional regulator [Burkholderiales bacterium]|nr:TetR/AcrR family transcriptional regulator [Burkholderiales bacterium]
MPQLSFRTKVLQAREEAIVATVKRLLAEKGYDQMTVDAVAAEVGIAKASLYKHFASKEALAAAAMVQTMDRALQTVAQVQDRPGLSALERLKAVTRWTLETQLAGEMPTLPSQNSALRNALLADRGYMDRLMTLSDQLGEWIVQAQADRSLDTRLPPQAVLFTLFARACDPVLGFLQAGGQHSDEQIIDWVMISCFDGLAARP